MEYELRGLTAFLRRSASAFHAAEAICEALRAANFVELREGERWALAPRGRYFVTRNQASVIAFTVPARGFAPLQGAASHTDSPCFRIKERGEQRVQDKYVTLNVERYGGMILSTWMDRPLGVAGRVLARTPGGIESRLVRIDRDVALIPSLAIHLNREANEGYKFNAQVDMQPLWGGAASEGGLMRAVVEAAGVEPDQIAGSDLYLYNRMPPSVWGEGESYISAPRLDDLMCAYTSLCAFLAARPGEHINLYCAFDSEEVGSGTRQGANSDFLEGTLRRAARALDADEEALAAALASSFLVSADNAHALHPNHPEKCDPTNRCYMNEGVVIKFSANQKYATDGASRAIFAEICARAGVPVQYFANRSDMPGGSTLGNISAAHVSIPTVDVGLAQLAMHSSCETAGMRDAEYLVRALTALYETEIRAEANGAYRFD